MRLIAARVGRTRTLVRTPGATVRDARPTVVLSLALPLVAADAHDEAVGHDPFWKIIADARCAYVAP